MSGFKLKRFVLTAIDWCKKAYIISVYYYGFVIVVMVTVKAMVIRIVMVMVRDGMR